MKTHEMPASYIIQFANRSGKLDDPVLYVQGPYEPKKVRRVGYGTTANRAEAWPFPNERQAEAKARVLQRHFDHGYPPGTSGLKFIVIPKEGTPAAS